MYCLDPVFYFVRCVGMSTYCVTKVEASKLLGVSVRMVDKYLHSGELTVDHMEKNKVVIDVTEVYSLRSKRKRG